MPSGKQTSFEFGEVAPTLHFRSDAVSYSSGLGKLRNKYVRRTGGVSNRAGFQFLAEHANQLNIPAPGGEPGIKGFTFWDPTNKVWKILEYYDQQSGSGTDMVFSVNFGAPLAQPVGDAVLSPAAHQARFTLLKDRIFVTPNALITKSGPSYNRNIEILIGQDPVPAEVLVREIGGYTFTAPSSITGTAHFDATLSAKAKASYLLTAVLKDGRELIVQAWDSSTVGPNLYYPDPYTWNEFVITWASATSLEDVKYFNWYRATGTIGASLNDAFWKLAGRTFYDGAANVIKFADFGADDASQTPPLDCTMLQEFEYVAKAQSAAYYQQRLILAMEHLATEAIKSGDIIVSKLGATEQIKAPMIYSDTGAFQFSVPVTDGTPVIAVLAMQGLMAFTQRAVYHIRGGDNVGQGVITPTSINPLLISEEGCSERVEPKMNGTRGYFINNSHTKIMAIEFGSDGNLQVGEASIFSEHLLVPDIIEIEMINGAENFIYFLRRDGKLVQVTANDRGSFGFSLVETEGYVESMFRGKAQKLYSRDQLSADSYRYYDVLMCYVIRNGIRTLERIVPREDKYFEGEFYADAFTAFGQRLVSAGSDGYAAPSIVNPLNPVAVVPYTSAGKINIEGASFNAGDIVMLRCQNAIIDTAFVLHFFYDDADGETQWLRFKSDGNAGVNVVDPPFTKTYQGYFESAVPASLQDVRAQSLTTTERNKRYTRWLPAFKELVGDDALYGAWLAASSDPTADGEAEVTVFADGEVLSSPNNPFRGTPLKIVRSGGNLSLDLPDYCSFGYVGVPYTSEFESLDLETADNRTLTDSKKLINKIDLGVYETRGGLYGSPDQSIEKMQEAELREDESFNNQGHNHNGYLSVGITSTYTRAGRINIKQVDPLPMTILSIYPKGIAGD